MIVTTAVEPILKYIRDIREGKTKRDNDKGTIDTLKIPEKIEYAS